MVEVGLALSHQVMVLTVGLGFMYLRVNFEEGSLFTSGKMLLIHLLLSPCSAKYLQLNSPHVTKHR